MLQSISEIAVLTGFDRRRLKKALQDITPAPGPKGALLYESTTALPLVYLQPGAGDSHDLTAERARLAFHQANRAELDYKALEGSLLSVDQVLEVIGRDYSAIRAKLLAIPSKAAPVLSGLSTVAVHQQLLTLISEALEELVAENVYAEK